MAVKKLCVHPGDLLEIHVIQDKELNANLEEWRDQVRPQKIQVIVGGIDRLQFTNPCTTALELVTLGGELIRYLQ